MVVVRAVVDGMDSGISGRQLLGFRGDVGVWRELGWVVCRLLRVGVEA